MGGSSISIDVDDAKAQAFLSKMKIRSADMIPVFRHAKEELKKANVLNFTTGGLPSGGWPAREDDYAWPILRKSGRLFDSLATLSGPPNIITPKFAEFGTSVNYAKFHESGTTEMAHREVVFEPRGFAKDVADAAADHIVRGALFS